jgi:hypothetical protein
MGIWHELRPRGLSKRDANSGWVFAHYIEAPSERDDGRWYHIFYFRDRDRTMFGVKKFNVLIHSREMERMATRVVRDAAFRQALLSDDPSLPMIWKRR